MGKPPEDFKDFFHLEFARLRDFGYVLTGSWFEAEELAQEAMVRTLRAWDRIRDRENPGLYARAVLANRRRTIFRRSVVAARVEPVHVPHAEAADALEERAVLWEAVRSLPRRQKAAVVLRFYEDMTEAQTAAALGCAVGTVKSLVHRALETLRGRLGEANEITSIEGEVR